ncbi:MAG TPA: M56 family metallopeptidase [Gemmatimonadaceae bacterium]|jgi:bla regulator protein BlaR1|nr:M56 family metallopeptidase [Gemmatimonadaceae bacterium]
MLTWLLVKILLGGGMLTLAAHCAERLSTIQGGRTRWIWIGALLLVVGPLGLQLKDINFRSSHAPIPIIQPGGTGYVSAEEREHTRPSNVYAFDDQTLVPRRPPPIITVAGHRVFILPDIDLALAWGTLSVIATLFLTVMYLQFRRIRRRWPIGTLEGVRVRIAPDGGPVVIGLWHPEIVIPQWLLGRSADEQRAVLAHEQEHIHARDHWVLAAACGVVALVPWCPWVWWMVSRLRLAIELDCDARVMRRGVAPQTYGSLLIDVAERGSGLPVRVLALADSGSHLKRRLRRIGPHRLPFAAPMQVILFGAAALSTLPLAIIDVGSGGMQGGDEAMVSKEGLGSSCVPFPANYNRSDNHIYRAAKSPQDSARAFFSSPATTWRNGSGSWVFWGQGDM